METGGVRERSLLSELRYVQDIREREGGESERERDSESQD